MSFDVVTAYTSAAVATNGTITLAYPTNRSSGFYSAVGHKAQASGLMNALELNTGFTLTFNATVSSGITFTYKGSTSIPAGSKVTVQLNILGTDGAVPDQALTATPRVQMAALTRIHLGTPIATVANNISVSATITAPAAAVLALTTLDVPRNVVGAWTNTAVVTVVGTDEYGVVMSEASASGTSFTGKKAFKTITSITPSATVTAATFGVGNVLGLPIYLGRAGGIIANIQDGAVASAGTVVAGVSTAASTTSGDVRGTYVPNVAPDASKKYDLIVVVDDITFKGVTQA